MLLGRVADVRETTGGDRNIHEGCFRGLDAKSFPLLASFADDTALALVAKTRFVELDRPNTNVQQKLFSTIHSSRCNELI